MRDTGRWGMDPWHLELSLSEPLKIPKKKSREKLVLDVYHLICLNIRYPQIQMNIHCISTANFPSISISDANYLNSLVHYFTERIKYSFIIIDFFIFFFISNPLAFDYSYISHLLTHQAPLLWMRTFNQTFSKLYLINIK